MTNWKNVAGYEVYKNNNLVYVSSERSFTVNPGIDANTVIYAVSALGEKVEVTF